MNLISTILRFVRLLWLIPLRGLAYLWPRSSKNVVMGAWMGNLFGDNPKYLCLYLLEHTDYNITWVGNDIVRDYLPNHGRLRFARKGSFNAFFALMRARVWICCQAWNIDLTQLPIKGFATIIDTWHGIPVKQVGQNVPSRTTANKPNVLKRLANRLQYEQKEWLLVCSNKMAEILTTGVPGRYSMKRLLPYGTPRNDYLIKNATNFDLITKLKRKYAQVLGFDADKKVVLYMPTWRSRGDCVYAFYNQQDAQQKVWRKMLDDNNAVLIEKHHYGTYAKYPMTKASECSVVITADQQKDVDVQELLLISDVLISDYSGAYIDYALLQRPILHFVYDLDEYATSDSGLAYDLESVAAGPMIVTCDELIIEVDSELKSPVFAPANGFRSLVVYERGSSCERIVDFMDKQSGR